MRSPVPSFLRPHHWLWRVIAMLAMASQIVLAVVPLAEGREDRMASHVEAGGVQTHYAHSDATCISCQARSIHGVSLRHDASWFEGVMRLSAVAPRIDRAVSIDVHSPSNPRAPPRSI